MLATVLFTDIVGSTDRAALIGDERWRDLLDRHDQGVRAQIERFRGREVKTMGDGFVATFDSPGRAIACALAIRETLKSFDIAVRAGIHSGEIEVRGDDVAGMAVHIGARVSALAGPGEVLVSSTVKDLVTGSSVDFVERGQHELKGVPGTWRLFAVDLSLIHIYRAQLRHRAGRDVRAAPPSHRTRHHSGVLPAQCRVAVGGRRCHAL